MAPEGFHSVSGTELNMKLAPVQVAATVEGDRMAKTLLKKGDVYGRQFVVYQALQAYPAYVVTYTCPDDFPSPEETQVVVTVVGHTFTVVSHAHKQ